MSRSMTMTCRSWMSMRTGVPASGMPSLMWCMRPPRRSVTDPVAWTMSSRMRKCAAALLSGVALSRAVDLTPSG